MFCINPVGYKTNPARRRNIPVAPRFRVQQPRLCKNLQEEQEEMEEMEQVEMEQVEKGEEKLDQMLSRPLRNAEH